MPVTTRSRSAIRRVRRKPAVLGMVLLVASTGLGLSSCTKEQGSPNGPAMSSPSSLLEAVTDDQGFALIVDASGETLFEAEAYDSLGHPLTGLDVTYITSDADPLLAFNQAESGDPAGTFLIESGSAALASEASGDSAPDIGVFILNLLDPTQGRLYDPARDGFSPTRYPNIERIRQVVAIDDLLLILQTSPSLTDGGVKTRGELVGGMQPAHRERLFTGLASGSWWGVPLLHRFAMLVLFAQNQHDSYRYHCFELDNLRGRMFLPLGVQATVTFSSPLDGETFAGAGQRQQTIAGRINLPPTVTTADGGRVELRGNGVLISNALGVGWDQAGTGSAFTSIPLELAVGENALQVSVYVNEANRGLENGAEGLAGQATLTLHYEEDSGSHAPVFTSISYPTSFPCPDGSLPVTFHFSDPDADVVTAFERAQGVVNGAPVEYERSAAVADHPNLSCLTGASADCTIVITYGSVMSGSWFDWEFWVVDATGLASNHLAFRATIEPGCDPFTLNPAQIALVVATPGPPS